jgi:Fur family ferric uptake transcriptional regulator
MVYRMKTDFIHFMKERNLSLTLVRLAVPEALHHRPNSDAASVFNFVQETISTTSIQAIYNNLNTLLENEVIREIKPKGCVSLYEMHKQDNHYHLVCRSCDYVIDTCVRYMRHAYPQRMTKILSLMRLKSYFGVRALCV